MLAVGLALFCPLGHVHGLEPEPESPSEGDCAKRHVELFEIIAETSRSCRSRVFHATTRFGDALNSASNHGPIVPVTNLTDQSKRNGFGGPLRL